MQPTPLKLKCYIPPGFLGFFGGTERISWLYDIDLELNCVSQRLDLNSFVLKRCFPVSLLIVGPSKHETLRLHATPRGTRLQKNLFAVPAITSMYNSSLCANPIPLQHNQHYCALLSPSHDRELATRPRNKVNDCSFFQYNCETDRGYDTQCNQ